MRAPCVLFREHAVVETLKRKVHMHDPKGKNISKVKFMNFNLWMLTFVASDRSNTLRFLE